MRLQGHTFGDMSQASVFVRGYISPVHCPHCGDLMVAPEHSEFYEGGEIRHHWACEACGRPSHTVVELPQY